MVTTKTIRVELPPELVEQIGSTEPVADRVRQSLERDLLREAEITARLLEVIRYDIVDLMARFQIPSSPLAAEEVGAEVKAACYVCQPCSRELAAFEISAKTTINSTTVSCRNHS